MFLIFDRIKKTPPRKTENIKTAADIVLEITGEKEYYNQALYIMRGMIGDLFSNTKIYIFCYENIIVESSWLNADKIGGKKLGEIADDTRDNEFNNWFSMSEADKEKYKNKSRQEISLYNFKIAQNYDNTVWRDRNGNVTSFIDMDGFHLWNVKTFILRSHNRGLQNKLMYIDLALAKLNYTVEDYRKDCEKLRKKNGG